MNWLLAIFIVFTLLTSVYLMQKDIVYINNYESDLTVKSDVELFGDSVHIEKKSRRVKRYAVKVGTCPVGRVKFGRWCIPCKK